METIKIATLDINGITSRARIDMLRNFLPVHGIDILFVQEATSPETMNIGGYETHHNIGFSMRGTAILAKDGITLTKITKLPSGRVLAAEYRGTLLINIYIYIYIYIYMFHPVPRKGTNVSTFLTMNYHIYYNSQQLG